MQKIFIFGALLFTTFQCNGQSPIEGKNFTPAQKAEWDKFIDHWKGNGKGTCMPIMEHQISAGNCTRFGFTADLTIGKDGTIKRVKVAESRIVCEDKAVQKELLKCFTQALHDNGMALNRLSGRVIRKAEL